MTAGLREGRAEADPGHPRLHRPPARAVEQDTGADTPGGSHPGQVNTILDDLVDNNDLVNDEVQVVAAEG